MVCRESLANERTSSTGRRPEGRETKCRSRWSATSFCKKDRERAKGTVATVSREIGKKRGRSRKWRSGGRNLFHAKDDEDKPTPHLLRRVHAFDAHDDDEGK